MVAISDTNAIQQLKAEKAPINNPVFTDTVYFPALQHVTMNGFSIRLESGQPVIYFGGSGNKIKFDTNGAWEFYIAGAKMFRIDGNGNAQLRGTLTQSAGNGF